nr:DUF4230 domain-containing protein [Corallococcus exiguus]
MLWISYTRQNPHGRAIVFADARLGFDFQRFDSSHLRPVGTRVDVLLPPFQVTVVLRPGETEIVDFTLDSAQPAQRREKARLTFEQEVRQDPRLREKVRRSAERALRGLLLTLGFREVRFVEKFPAGTSG